MIGKWYLKRVGGYDPDMSDGKKPLFKRTGAVSAEEREHLARIGAVGGKSKSINKLAAVKKNLKKAMAKRFPNSAKWKSGSRAAAD